MEKEVPYSDALLTFTVATLASWETFVFWVDPMQMFMAENSSRAKKAEICRDGTTLASKDPFCTLFPPFATFPSYSTPLSEHFLNGQK